MKTYELPIETKASTGFTHKVILTNADFTAAAATQTFSLLPVAAGSVISNAAHKLVTPLVSSDGTLTSAAYTLGNTATATSIMSSTEVLGTATEVVNKAMTVTAPVAITAADQFVVAAFTATTSKLLSSVTAGEIHIYLQVVDTNEI
jgi:hypothetical protein